MGGDKTLTEAQHLGQIDFQDNGLSRQNADLRAIRVAIIEGRSESAYR